MIDAHCHLEQKDYDKDRKAVIEACKKELKAVVTSCAHPDHFDLTMKISEENKDFIFPAIGIHPEYIKDLTPEMIQDHLSRIEKNKGKIVAIGEVGLDYHWVQEEEWKEKQRRLFRETIRFSKRLGLPLVIHCRNAFEDTLGMLEEEGAEKVLLHMWGDHNSVERIVANGWHISCNAMIMKSKTYRKVAQKTPLENLMLETDAPWLSPEGGRNTPLTIKKTAEKMAGVKGTTFDDVWAQCGDNAVRFFSLPLRA